MTAKIAIKLWVKKVSYIFKFVVVSILAILDTSNRLILLFNFYKNV